MITQEMLDAAVEQAYRYAHRFCRYAATDQSFPVGEDGRMDCTGLMLRALYLLGLVDEPLNCDQIDQKMGRLGFIKSTDIQDVFRYHGFVQWVFPEWVGSEHVHHTFYSLGGDGRTISKYDTGSDWRIQSGQPFRGVPVDEWGGKYIFKHIWILPGLPGEKEKDNHNIFIQIGGNKMAATYKLDQIGRGDKSNSVLLVQEILKARGMYKGGLDRNFGPATEQAVIDYQNARIKAGAKLGKADGIVGPKTWEDLLGLAKA